MGDVCKKPVAEFGPKLGFPEFGIQGAIEKNVYLLNTTCINNNFPS